MRAAGRTHVPAEDETWTTVPQHPTGCPESFGPQPRPRVRAFLAMASDAPPPPLGFPYCPPCQTPFSASVPSAYPQSLECGHNACAECVAAAAVMSPPCCPVCMRHIAKEPVPDHGMACYAAAAFQEVGEKLDDDAWLGPHRSSALSCSACHASEASHLLLCEGRLLCDACALDSSSEASTVHVGDPALRSHALQLGASCSSGAVCALESCVRLKADATRMLARKDASISSFCHTAASVKAAVDAHVNHVIQAITKDVKDVMKALEAQMEALTVRANQLGCAASLCSQALRPAVTPSVVAHAVVTATRALSLVSPYAGPAVPTLVAVASDGLSASDFIATTLSRKVTVHPPACRVAYSRFFQPNKECEIEVTVMDTCREPVACVTCEDFVVSVTPAARCAPTAAPTARVEKREGVGKFAVVYSVPAALDAVVASVAVAGVQLRPPFEAQKFDASTGYHAHGVHVCSFPVSGSNMFGLAVSPCHQRMAVADYGASGISILDATSGARITSIGAHAAGTDARPGSEVVTPFKLCFTPQGTLLVCCYRAGVVQEWSADGVLVRDIECEQPLTVCCNKDVIVVGCAMTYGLPPFAVFDACSGALLRRFGKYGDALGDVHGEVGGMRISPDGTMLLTADRDAYCAALHCLASGEFVKAVGVGVIGRGFKDVEFGAGGIMIVADCEVDRVCAFTADGDELLSAFRSVQRGECSHDGTASDRALPCALAVCGNLLYVLNRGARTVEVFQ